MEIFIEEQRKNNLEFTELQLRRFWTQFSNDFISKGGLPQYVLRCHEINPDVLESMILNKDSDTE